MLRVRRYVDKHDLLYMFTDCFIDTVHNIILLTDP